MISDTRADPCPRRETTATGSGDIMRARHRIRSASDTAGQTMPPSPATAESDAVVVFGDQITGPARYHAGRRRNAPSRQGNFLIQACQRVITRMGSDAGLTYAPTSAPTKKGRSGWAAAILACFSREGNIRGRRLSGSFGALRDGIGFPGLSSRARRGASNASSMKVPSKPYSSITGIKFQDSRLIYS